MAKKLRRSTSDTVIAGVCGGIGACLDVDPDIVRIILVLFTLLGGAGPRPPPGRGRRVQGRDVATRTFDPRTVKTRTFRAACGGSRRLTNEGGKSSLSRCRIQILRIQILQGGIHVHRPF